MIWDQAMDALVNRLEPPHWEEEKGGAMSCGAEEEGKVVGVQKEAHSKYAPSSCVWGTSATLMTPAALLRDDVVLYRAGRARRCCGEEATAPARKQHAATHAMVVERILLLKIAVL